MKNRVAIIPARGGSKRIKRKNIIDFCGKPMIAWTIEAAIKSNLFDEVIVSTEDNEIKKISEKYGAYVPFLRKYHADDYSSVSLATLGTIKQLKQEGIGEYEDIIQLMANCPLRDEKAIISSLKNF